MSDFNSTDVMGWDTAIENDGPDFEPLPAGDYIFEVTDFQKGQHNGSPKIPPCPRADLTLKVYSQDGKKNVTVHEVLFLHKSMEWKIASFFRCIGQKKHGEKLIPNWNKVVGATGCAKFYIDLYRNSQGKEYKNNKVDRYYDKDATPANNSAPEITNSDAFQSIPDGQAEEIPFN